GQIVWVKDLDSKEDEDKTSGRYSILNQHEFIHIFRKNGERKAPSEEAVSKSALTKDERNQYFRSVWTMPPVAKMEGHPAVSPDELARRIIKMYSFTGETVLDPFLGSGTTCKAAQELGRRSIGYEREEKYRELIEKKIASTNTQPQKFEAVGEFAKRQLEELENNQPQKTNALSESLQKLKNQFPLISEADVKSIKAETNLQENAAA
ncbi:MAG: site-specific DNA-methyltransferase, partial [Desulfamplus sp.]|nr:site-specific DNA-methyltransferase [Desulfamplus sp.]